MNSNLVYTLWGKSSRWYTEGWTWSKENWGKILKKNSFKSIEIQEVVLSDNDGILRAQKEGRKTHLTESYLRKTPDPHILIF